MARPELCEACVHLFINYLFPFNQHIGLGDHRRWPAAGISLSGVS